MPITPNCYLATNFNSVLLVLICSHKLFVHLILSFIDVHVILGPLGCRPFN